MYISQGLKFMKLIGKRLKYILENSSLNSNLKVDHYGREAVLAGYTIGLKVKHSKGFVISSFAFDDYILESGLAGKITKILSTVRPLIKESARDASEQITNLIFSSEIPETLLKEYEQVVGRLFSSLENVALKIRISHVMPEYVVPNDNFELFFLSSVNSFATSLKRSISEIFSTEAIELRVNSYYKGVITSAFLVQLVQKPEISGRVFFESRNSIAIEAYYGITKPDNFVDTYRYDVSLNKIVERNVYPQVFMDIFNGVDEKGRIKKSTVEVSKEWQSSQKLVDRFQTEIFSSFLEIHKKLHKPICLDFLVCSGEIFIDKIEVMSSYDNKVQEVDTYVMSQLKMDEQSTTTVKDQKDQKDQNDQKEKEPSISELVEEINAVVKGQKGQLELSEVGVDIPRKESLEIFLDIDDDEVPHNVAYRRSYSEVSELEVKDRIFETDLYLELSRLTASRISALRIFVGSLVDGTELILSHGVLPEEVSDVAEKTNLIDKFALHIFTASKSVKKCVYIISDMGESEFNLLGRDAVYSTGEERLLRVPESLEFEASVIKRSRNVYNVRNISICIPSVRSIKSISEIKRALYSKGIRRSSNLEIFAEISYPSVIFQLQQINSELVDGIVLNLNKMYAFYYNRPKPDREDLDKFADMINDISKLMFDKSIKCFILGSDIDVELVELIDISKLEAIVFANIPNDGLLERIWQKGRKVK
ncbi:hypothetical protein D6810_02635 [Candidatus Dojkabacteria bacterium]|uniref:Phosphoenolpyruvate synthase n=1 Tax=Candidatus Dojkabacteria bacterium TaxID=2099670 RepID=A0A3M0Z0A3_9BACT|nr:MAG: hypothetical protein D6810_02635 [Candidatus Dojkabacteria bacterium]